MVLHGRETDMKKHRILSLFLSACLLFVVLIGVLFYAFRAKDKIYIYRQIDGRDLETWAVIEYDGKKPLSLPIPKAWYGYQFVGWTGDDLETMSFDHTLSMGLKGDREYVAHFIKVYYDIIFLDITNLENVKIVHDYDPMMRMYFANGVPDLPTPIYDSSKYTFDGWFILRSTAPTELDEQFKKGYDLKKLKSFKKTKVYAKLSPINV